MKRKPRVPALARLEIGKKVKLLGSAGENLRCLFAAFLRNVLYITSTVRKENIMTTIKAFIKKYSVLIYFALTFTISWGGLLAIGGHGGTSSGTAWQSDPRLPLMILAMLGGPSVAGILLTTLVYGRTGLREVLSRLLKWRVGTGWYVVAVLTAPLVYTVVHIALSLVSPVYLPTLLSTGDKTSLLLSAVAVGLGVGLFEELGWTGFAIPELRRRYGVFTTGLVVGVLWGAWHLLTNDLWIKLSCHECSVTGATTLTRHDALCSEHSVYIIGFRFRANHDDLAVVLFCPAFCCIGIKSNYPDGCSW
jgi:membrane protease YdiL (CAAX protease family)